MSEPIQLVIRAQIKEMGYRGFLSLLLFVASGQQHIRFKQTIKL